MRGFWVLALLFLVCPAAHAQNPSTAFFYGQRAPLDLLAQFDQVVVQPEHIDNLAALQKGGTEVFAYLSVGEAERFRSGYRELDKRWFLGVNHGWGSDIVDLTQSGWREHLLEKRMAALWAAGYRGFFLDTLDSYQAVIKDPAGQTAQARALAGLIRAMHQRFPGIKLLFNRGFEVLPEVAGLAAGMVAESLFQSWSPLEKCYTQVNEQDRAWLLGRLQEARDRYHLPVTVIDYLPPQQRELARQTARRIADLGFTPWIANPALDYMGVGAVEAMPRRVLVLYDGQEQQDLVYSAAHRFLAMPLEHLGYSVDYLDVRDTLPEQVLTGRYAGIATWFTDDELSDARRYRSWLLRQIDEGMKVAIFGHPGFSLDKAFLKRLGLAPFLERLRAPLKITHTDTHIGFEAQPIPQDRTVPLWRAVGADVSSGISPHLSLTDAIGTRFDPVFTASWGGMALDPYVLDTGFADRRRWIVDPFAFLRQALRLPAMPVPDLTTENGLRLLMAHIDGDGFPSRAEMPGTPFAAQVILDEVLKAYPVPTTVSIIEGELGPKGLYPALAPQLESIAREIFRLPLVEIASHSYSHPFQWRKLQNDTQVDGGYHLDIPGYVFDLRREIEGSVGYINTRLAPPGKPVRVFLWSGDALPGKDALAMTRTLGLANLNGGNTVMTMEHPSLTQAYPAARSVDGLLQVYASIANENVYTDLWRNPFYGYKKVIETFRLTDAPRRLKPISIYYHFYSGSKPASLKALHEVYRWALDQETLPVWVSDYSAKVEDFERLTLARRLDGGWQIRGLGALRTLRLDPGLGWPDLEHSQGVASVRDLPQGRYVSFGGDSVALLHLTPQRPETPYLEQANATVLRWQPQGESPVQSQGHTSEPSIRLRLQGRVPVHVAIAGAPIGVEMACRVVWHGGELRGSLRHGALHFDFPVMDTGEAQFVCH